MKKVFLCVLLLVLLVSAAWGGATENLLKAVLNPNTTPEQITALIKAGADVNANGATALMSAARNNSNPEVIKALVNVGADIKAKEDFG